MNGVLLVLIIVVIIAIGLAVYSSSKASGSRNAASLADAKAIVPASEWYIAPVKASDIQAEQSLSDAFFEAGEITKQVDVTTIADNLLPDGFDSSKLD